MARSRNVAWYVAGNSLSNVGTWIYNLSAALLMYRLTGSTFLVGTVTFAQFIGTVVLAPWAGSAADRFDRRKLLAALQFAAAVPPAVLAVATALGVATTWLVLVATTVLGLTVAFSSPVLQSLIPLLVDDAEVDVAIALSTVTYQLARAIGPVIAALVIAEWGLPVAIGMNAVSYLFFVAALLIVRPRTQERATRDRSGFRVTTAAAWGDMRIRHVLLTVMAISMASDPITTLAPEYADRVLGRSDTVAGALMGAFGVGSMLTGLFLISTLRAWSHGFVAAMAAQMIGLIVFGLAPHLAVSLVGSAIAGSGFVAAITQATSRLHALAPQASLGRLMALWSVAFLGIRPFAALLDGAIADILGVRAAALTLTGPLAVVAALSWRSWRAEQECPLSPMSRSGP